jgi:predicted nucleic acid-binding protein
MSVPEGYLIDTNILLRLTRPQDSQHQLVKSALTARDQEGQEFYVSIQNMAEYWNVSTRPIERNGYGLPNAGIIEGVEEIERTMVLLPETIQVYPIWRQLVITHAVRGVQVHDARLVAIMLAYGLTRILTLNTGDFERFPEIAPLHPSQVPAKSV